MTEEMMPRPRKEAEPVFGDELDQAVSNIENGIIVTGPSGSGKTVFGTALTTLGLAAVDVNIPAGENLSADFSLAGYRTESTEFQDEFEEDLEDKLTEYLNRYKSLPPIVLIDEILPEYIAFLTKVADSIRAQYKAKNMPHPQFIWIVQGNEENYEALMGQNEFLQRSHRVSLTQKENDPDINNSGYRAAAARTDVLRKQLGSDRFERLVTELKQKFESAS